MATDSQPIPISVRCLNTKLHAKAVFSNAGLLTNLFARATGAAANAKNEKRYIKIFQSRPFRIGTRPDTEYELIYTSETFDDVSDICPSLLAYIKTFKDMDTQLRLSIYYNSSITGSKDVLLGLTNFTVADMLRSCSYNAVGTMTIDIHSEYCTGIKAYIEIIDPLPSVLDEHKLPVLANKHEKNPLAQTYVFFNDVDLSTPLLKVVEQTWEPKFSGMVSLLFLENFLAAMRKSVVAWKLRQEQERIRQGKFMSDHEAFGYGWHVLEITVRGARFAIQEQTNNPTLTLSPQPPAGVTPTANYTLRFPLTPEFVPELDRVNPNAALLPPSPQLERRSRASSSHGLGPGSASTGGSFAGRGAGLVKSKSGRLTSTASTATGATPPTGKNGAVLPTKKYDDTLPSTFVQIYWEDPAKTFVEPIARTNTEYYTPFPVYGTNIHAQYARKGAHQQAVPLQEKIQVSTVEKEVIYNVFEATNRCFLPKRWQTWTLTTASPSAAANRSRLSSHDEATGAAGAAGGAASTVARTSDTGNVAPSPSTASAAMSTADDQVYVFDSQQAQHTTFKIYVANTHPQSQLRLDVMCETLQGHVRPMATCALPVADLTQFSGWLPLTMHKEHGHHHHHHQQHPFDAAAASAAAGAAPGGSSSASFGANAAATASTAAYDLGELLVDIKVHSPPPSSVPLQAASLPLDVMDEVFHLQRRTDGTIDLFSDATAVDYRYNLAQCYEWMWALGMHSQDPLLVDGGRSIASHLSRTDLEQLVDQMAAHETTGPSSGATSPTTLPPPPPPPPSTAASSATPSAATTPRVRRPSVSFQGATSGGAANGGGVSSALSMDAPAAPLTGRSLSGDSAPLPSSPAVVSTKSLPATDAATDGANGSGTGTGNDTGGVTVVERSLSADDLTDLVQQALDPRKPVRRGSKLLPTLRMDDDSDDEDDDDDEGGVIDGETVGGSAVRRRSDGGRLRLEDVDRALTSTTGPADVSVDELSHSASHGALLASLLRMDAATDGDDAGDGDASAAAQSPMAAASESTATTSTTMAAPEASATATDAAAATTTTVEAATAAPPTAADATAAAATPTVVSLSIDGVTTTLNPTANANASGSGSGSGHRPTHRRASTTKISAKRRVDVTYELSWITQHIRELQDIIDEVELLLAGLRQKIRADRCFRSSVFKKEAEWQMLPTNLHYQVVGVQCHRPKRRGGAIAPDTSIPVDVIHSVTSGAMTPHMLKHKKGGLLHQEQDWDAKKNEVHILKGRFLAQVREYRQSLHGGLSPGRLRWLLPRDGSGSGSGSGSKDGGAYKTLLLLGHKVQAWESQAVEIGRRRMYAMSQSISIAVNSFLLKLNLLCQGAIEVSLAEKWLTAGFLLVFEGLLSVTGHEKSMLEDTITAVDALRNYRIRLLSKAAYVGSNTKATPPTTTPSVYQQNLTRQSSRYVTPATFARHRSTSQNSVRSSSSSAADENVASSAAARASESGPQSGLGAHGATDDAANGDNEDDEEADLLADPDFTFQGREIRIYLSRAAIAMLPATYRDAIRQGDGALVVLFPVLFTQGIDMQQTMANTFGSDMSAFELQYLVNNRALQWVNTYCHRVQPLDSTSSHPHTYHAARTDDIVQLPHETHGGSGGSGGASPVAMSSTMTPPPPPPTSAAYSPGSAAAAATAGKAPYHPLVTDIHQAMNSSAAQLSLKNVDLLEAVERLTVMLDGVRVTFCKSGKDRTGMAVTLDQARQLSARYGLFNGLLAQSRHLSTAGGGSSASASSSTTGGASSSNSNGNSNANTFASLLDERLANLANLMRVYGTRVSVAEKNIGRPVYSINLLQARFLPPLLRPPPAVCEAMLKKDNS